jgi:hypothetical protein
MSPNSASCERVFALLKSMFGEEQMSVLADYVSAALMLRFNKQARGGLSCYSCTAVNERERKRACARNERVWEGERESLREMRECVCEGACIRRRTSLRVPREVARCAVGARSKFCVSCVNHVCDLP